MKSMSKTGWLVTVVALVLGISGTATAGKLITGKQVKKATLTGKHIKNGSLGESELSASARDALRGRQGPVGPAGAPGATGPAGGLNDVVAVDGPVKAYGPSSVVSAQAACPAGSKLVGGGFKHQAGGGTSIDTVTGWDAPAGANTWGVILINHDNSSGDELVVVALCAQGTGATAARSQRTATRAAFERTLGALRQKLG